MIFYFITLKIQLQVYGHYVLTEGSTQNYLIDSFMGDLRLPQRWRWGFSSSVFFFTRSSNTFILNMSKESSAFTFKV